MSLSAYRVFAAVAVSGAVHVGAAMVGWSIQPTPVDGAAGTTPLRVVVATAVVRERTTERSADVRVSPATAPVAPQPISIAGMPHVAAARHKPAARVSDQPADDPSNEPVSESIEVVSPTPVTYPVFTLPPNDDPRRIGLTRLVLVVSSQGTTIDVVVTASTMSQDYVDALVKTFAAMRFEPARVRGLPYPGTYEVVVNFAYEPPGGAAL